MAVIPNSAHPLPVFITPLSNALHTSECSADQPTTKVLLKVVSKAGKNQKVFTLRNIDTKSIITSDQLKDVIRNQLSKDIIAGDFDVGHVSGGSMVSVRNQADLAEIWADIKAGKKVVMWCDGLKDVKKNKRSVSTEQDENTDEDRPRAKKRSSQEDREERVQTTIENLQKKHGSNFTQMQIRIWSELIIGGLHSSLDDPPTSSMFIRAGKSNNTSVKNKDTNMTEAFTQAAVAISSALSPRSSTPSMSVLNTGTSPAKLIESRSKCYKQLHDLNSLREACILTETEYLEEKEAVLAVLRKISA